MRFSIVENVAMPDDIFFKISRGSQRPYGAESKKSNYLFICVLLDPSLLSPYGGLYIATGVRHNTPLAPTELASADRSKGENQYIE